jgi:hypothetical protein
MDVKSSISEEQIKDQVMQERNKKALWIPISLVHQCLNVLFGGGEQITFTYYSSIS